MFLDDLKETLNICLNNENVDEWIIVNFIGSKVETLAPEEAFSFIDDVVKLLLERNDDLVAIDLLEIIGSLAETSRTTEIPTLLLLKKNELTSRFSHMGENEKNSLAALFRYYRIAK